MSTARSWTYYDVDIEELLTLKTAEVNKKLRHLPVNKIAVIKAELRARKTYIYNQRAYMKRKGLPIPKLFATKKPTEEPTEKSTEIEIDKIVASIDENELLNLTINELKAKWNYLSLENFQKIKNRRILLQKRKCNKNFRDKQKQHKQRQLQFLKEIDELDFTTSGKTSDMNLLIPEIAMDPITTLNGNTESEIIPEIATLDETSDMNSIITTLNDNTESEIITSDTESEIITIPEIATLSETSKINTTLGETSITQALKTLNDNMESKIITEVLEDLLEYKIQDIDRKIEQLRTIRDRLITQKVLQKHIKTHHIKSIEDIFGGTNFKTYLNEIEDLAKTLEM